MEALANGARFANVYCNVTDTHASNAVVKAQRLITYCHAVQAVVMTTGIFSVYALNAIIQKGGGFLVTLRHP
jgi:hypothetical protein